MYKSDYSDSKSSEYSSEDTSSSSEDEDDSLNISNKSKLDLYNNTEYKGVTVEKKDLIYIDTGDRNFNSEYNRFYFKCKLSTSGNSWNKYPIFENTRELPQTESQNRLGIRGSPNINGFIYNGTRYGPYNGSQKKGMIITYNNIYTSSENILSIQNNIKNINCIKIKSVFVPKIFFNFKYNQNIKLNSSQQFMFLDIKELNDNYLTTSQYRNVYAILKKKENAVHSEYSKYIEYIEISNSSAVHKGIYPSINTLTFNITFPNKLEIDNSNIINSIEDYLKIDMIIPYNVIENQQVTNYLYILLEKPYQTGYFKEGTNILLQNINNFGNSKVTYPSENNFDPKIYFEDFYVKKIIKKYIASGHISKEENRENRENNRILPFIFLEDNKIIFSEKNNFYSKIDNIKVCQMSSSYFPELDIKIFYDVFYKSKKGYNNNLLTWIKENNDDNNENELLIKILVFFLEKEYFDKTISIPLGFNLPKITKKIFGFNINLNILKSNLDNTKINEISIKNEIIFKNMNNIILENKCILKYFPTYIALFANLEGHSRVMEMILKFRRTAYEPYQNKPFSDSGYFQIKDDLFLLPSNDFTNHKKYITFYYKVRGSSECPVDNKGNLYVKNNQDPYDIYGSPTFEEQLYDKICMFRNNNDQNETYCRKGLLSFFNTNEYKFIIDGQDISYTKTKGYPVHNYKEKNVKEFNNKNIEISFRNSIIPDKEGNFYINEPHVYRNDKKVWPPVPDNADIFPKLYSQKIKIYKKETELTTFTQDMYNEKCTSSFSNIREDYFMLNGPRVVQESCIGSAESEINKNLEKTDTDANLYFISLKTSDIKYKIDLNNTIKNEEWTLLITSYIIDKYNINLEFLFEQNTLAIQQFLLLIYTDMNDIEYFYSIFIKTEIYQNLNGNKNEIIKIMVSYFEDYLKYNLKNFIFRKKLTELVNNFSTQKTYNWLNQNPQGMLLLVNIESGQSLDEIYSLSSYKLNYDYFDNKIWIYGSDSYLLWKNNNIDKKLEMIFIKNLNLSFNKEKNGELTHKWNLEKNNTFIVTNTIFSVYLLNDVIEIFTDKEENNSIYDLLQKEDNLGVLKKKEYDINLYPIIKTNNNNSNIDNIMYNIKSQILIKGKSNSIKNGEFPNVYLPEHNHKIISGIQNNIPYLNKEDFQEMKRISVLKSKKNIKKDFSNIIVIKDSNIYTKKHNKKLNYMLKNNFIAGEITNGGEILYPLLINKDLQTKILLEINSVEISTNIDGKQNIK